MAAVASPLPARAGQSPSVSNHPLVVGVELPPADQPMAVSGAMLCCILRVSAVVQPIHCLAA